MCSPVLVSRSSSLLWVQSLIHSKTRTKVSIEGPSKLIHCFLPLRFPSHHIFWSNELLISCFAFVANYSKAIQLMCSKDAYRALSDVFWFFWQTTLVQRSGRVVVIVVVSSTFLLKEKNRGCLGRIFKVLLIVSKIASKMLALSSPTEICNCIYNT